MPEALSNRLDWKEAVAVVLELAEVFERSGKRKVPRCALCHKDSGEGDPPTFPGLNDNDQLGDPTRIVTTIHRGTARMPPFADLTAEEIFSVASYVRNAWANDFGTVSPEEVAAVLAGLEGTDPLVSVWDGVFTEEQASRGQAVYPGPCGTCHGRRLNGAPDDPDMLSTPPWRELGSSATGTDERLPPCLNTLGRRCQKTTPAL